MAGTVDLGLPDIKNPNTVDLGIPEVEQPKVEQPLDYLKEDGKPLYQEDIINDPRYMAIVDKALATRFKDRGLVGKASTVLGAAGGDYKGKTPKERFEIWQNWNRSFAGGQTVTTANEVAFVAKSSGKELATLGESFTLFDSMGSIWGKDSDTLDALWDYGKSALYDPITLVSLGVGKALTAGGTKATSIGLRELAKAAARKAIKEGATKIAAKKIASETMKQGFKTIGTNVAKSSAVDLFANVGADYAYQTVMIDTGVQEDVSVGQLGLAALGTLAIPAIMGTGSAISAATKSKVAKNTIFEAYTNLDNTLQKMSRKEVREAILKRLDTKKAVNLAEGMFKDYAENADTFLPWKEAKLKAGKLVDERGLDLTVEAKTDLFWRGFLFGPVDNSRRGIVQSMNEAGLVYHPRFLSDLQVETVGEKDMFSNFLGDVLSELPDDFIARSVSDFEAVSGPINVGKTGVEIGANFKKWQSGAGKALHKSQWASRILQGDSSLTKDLLKSMSPDDEIVQGFDLARQTKYVQTVWKRLLTSHPGTVGMNIRGWGQVAALNNVSDAVLGVLLVGKSAWKKAIGQDELAARALQEAKGSVLGSLRRGISFLSPMDTMEAATKYLDAKPAIKKELMRYMAGDVGQADSLKAFGRNPDSGFNIGLEKSLDFIQAASGMKLQDETTKLLSFMTAMDTAIRKEYGMTYNKFMAQDEAFLEMLTPRFIHKVDNVALDRAVRETAAKSWSREKGKGLTLKIAKAVEATSKAPGFGFAIPFGQFFNTATATLGDYTGLNFLNHISKRAFRNKLNYHTEDGLELLAKGLVGWTAGAYFWGKGKDNLDQGLKWNQEERSDGSFADRTYDWPESYFRVIGQAIAHKTRDGEVPDELKTEAVAILGAQTMRDSVEAVKTIKDLLDATLAMDGSALGIAEEAVLGLGPRILSGATRPLDPINEAAKFMTGNFKNPDRNQGAKFWNNSLRYMDVLFDSDRPEKSYPTRGTDTDKDFGKVMLGVRGSQPPTSIERVMNSIGVPHWKAVRWQGEPEVKNRMNALVGPIFNAEADKLLEEHPDFFDLPLSTREKIFKDIKGRVKKTAESILDRQGVSGDVTVKVLSDLGRLNKKDLRRTMKRLGIEGDAADLLNEPGGLEKLRVLIFTTKDFDKIFSDY